MARAAAWYSEVHDDSHHRETGIIVIIKNVMMAADSDQNFTGNNFVL